MSDQELEGFVQKMLSQEASFAKFADRFSEKAQQALLFANEEAGLFNHNYIGTEHLLLGLLREGTGVAAKVLNECGVELEKVRKAVEFIVGRGKEPFEGEPGLTPRSVLEKFGAIQMLDVHFPTSDGRELVFRRYTQPEKDHKMLLAQLGWELPPQSPPRITQKGRLLKE